MNRFSPILATVWLGIALLCQAAEDEKHYGPLINQSPLVLTTGVREECVGPFFSHQKVGSQVTSVFAPFFSTTSDPELEMTEWDILYPLISYDCFGSEYRLHFGQLIAFSGGKNQADQAKDGFTLFPIYFRTRSAESNASYTAVMPFYGTVKNRLLRDEVNWVMFPLYVRSVKRDVITYNYLYPVGHVRHGNHLEGWQVWPFLGREIKDACTITNRYDEAEVIPGHEKSFYLWPFYLHNTLGLGTTNVTRLESLLPFYAYERSPLRDSTTYFWPLGYTVTDDRQQQFRERGMPWPLVVFASGPGKHTSRVFPFYSHAYNAKQQSGFWLWPLYKYNRIRSDPLAGDYLRIMFYLYMDRFERNTATKESRRRTTLWPLFLKERDMENNSHFQVLTVLEPFIPNNKSIERNYSNLYALWRAEKNSKTGASSESLLWNLYRSDATPDTKKSSIFFGLFQYQSGPDGKQWRIFNLPVGASKAVAAKPRPE
ncbi:MAG: hypothetical protein WCO56_23285 [Verrucomicrobiota bacterium]